MLKKAIVSLLLALVSVSANAKSFSVGDNLMCGLWEGKIVELYQGNKAKVQFTASYNDSRLKNEDTASVLEINHCNKQLPDSAKVATNKLSVKDVVACGQWRGEVKSVFESNIAKINFTSSYNASSYNDSREQSENITSVLEVNHCDKKLSDGTEIVNGIKAGDTVMCGLWKGSVIEVFTGKRARVLFTASYNDGKEKAESTTTLLEISHCQKQLN